MNLYGYPVNPLVDVDLRGLIHKKAKSKRNKQRRKRRRRKAAEAKADGQITPRQRKLAAAENKGPNGQPTAGQRSARLAVAKDFIGKHGKRYNRNTGKLEKLDDKGVADQVDGVNLEKPVVTGPPPPLPAELTQWQAPGNSRGSYFAPPGTSPNQLGIGDYGRSWSEPGAPIVRKQVTTHTVRDREQPYMQSTAGPIDDTWSAPDHNGSPGMVQPTDGGGTQYTVYEGADPNHPGFQP